MAAMLGALQDWDAIFFFDYEASSERGAFFKTAPNNFFSFNAVPAKLTSLAIFANVFLRGDVHPLTDELVSTPNKPLDGRLALEKRIAVSSAATSSNVPQVSGGTVLKTADGSVIWKVDDVMKRGTVQARMSRTIGVWGTIENQSFEFGALHWEVRSIPRGYGILVATSMDDKSIEASQKIVLLAATNTENAGMRWNSEKNSVGTHWGSGPTMACAIDAKIELPTKWKTVRVSALDGRGLPTKLLQSELKNGVLRFTISRSNETMWYSIEGQ